MSGSVVPPLAGTGRGRTPARCRGRSPARPRWSDVTPVRRYRDGPGTRCRRTPGRRWRPGRRSCDGGHGGPLLFLSGGPRRGHRGAFRGGTFRHTGRRPQSSGGGVIRGRRSRGVPARMDAGACPGARHRSGLDGTGRPEVAVRTWCDGGESGYRHGTAHRRAGPVGSVRPVRLGRFPHRVPPPEAARDRHRQGRSSGPIALCSQGSATALHAISLLEPTCHDADGRAPCCSSSSYPYWPGRPCSPR